MKRAKFSLAGESLSYDGVDIGETWQGHPVPYFTPDVARKILQDLLDDFGTRWGEGPGVFFHEENGDIEMFPVCELEEGEYYYPIGGRIWPWVIKRQTTQNRYE